MPENLFSGRQQPIDVTDLGPRVIRMALPNGRHLRSQKVHRCLGSVLQHDLVRGLLDAWYVGEVEPLDRRPDGFSELPIGVAV
jgi:hypothetical protein